MRGQASDRFALSGQELATKSGGLLLLAGSALILITVALPPAAVGSETAVVAAAIVSTINGLYLTLKRGPATVPMLALSVAVGTAVIAVTSREAGIGTGAEDNELLYVWVCLYAFNFLPVRVAAAELAGVGLSYAWVLATVNPEPGTALTRWLVVMVTLAVGGFLVYRLRCSRDRVEVDLATLARRDNLTGALNRGAIEDCAAVELARSRRYGHPVSLLLIDVDGLKALNDGLGHAEGDQLLRNVATSLAGATRQVDSVARIGGDEFAVLLPGVGTAESARVADRIRRALRTTYGKRPSTTVSIGIAASPDHAFTFDDLLAAADEAMYATKRAGGDGIAHAPRTMNRWDRVAR